MINFDLIQAKVYVGSSPNSRNDVARLKQLRVSALICLQSDADFKNHNIDWSELQRYYQESDISVHRHPILDFDEDDLAKEVGHAVLTLNRLLDQGHSIYVHCNSGICRAPAAVLGYLCHFEGMSFDAAMRQIQIARPIASPFRSAVKKALEDLAKDS